MDLTKPNETESKKKEEPKDLITELHNRIEQLEEELARVKKERDELKASKDPQKRRYSEEKEKFEEHVSEKKVQFSSQKESKDDKMKRISFKYENIPWTEESYSVVAARTAGFEVFDAIPIPLSDDPIAHFAFESFAPKLLAGHCLQRQVYIGKKSRTLADILHKVMFNCPLPRGLSRCEGCSVKGCGNVLHRRYRTSDFVMKPGEVISRLEVAFGEEAVQRAKDQAEYIMLVDGPGVNPVIKVIEEAIPPEELKSQNGSSSKKEEEETE
ncbi:hypothetical protein ADUPG1_008252 [Aduncisulcus paluster]|uniref:Uncharacterized protein n=1 Tax=Aduncisulcus paluster TaxID=2918883 RepID=A0ABQ5KRA0_9EUKA|nr:hypothetical protein ADUPG1_008252 [Aduncisulcus paluster]